MLAALRAELPPARCQDAVRHLTWDEVGRQLLLTYQQAIRTAGELAPE